MRLMKVLSLILASGIFAFAQAGRDFVQFKARLGFDDENEMIKARHYSADGTKLTLVGLKATQVWDIPTAKFISSQPHEIVELDRITGTYYEISPDGNKVITLNSIGSDGTKKEDRVNAYAYDLRTGKRIAVLERPDYSVRFAEWSADSRTLVTFSGRYLQKQTEISFWNGADLSFRNSVVVNDFTWHYLSPNDGRLYVGNGGQTKVLGLNYKEGNGDKIYVFNAQNAKLERELNAGGAEFDVDETITKVSPDGRYIATSKHKNIVVWDTASASEQPIYELATRDAKNQIVFEHFSGDGKYLFARQQRKDEFYETATGKLIADVPANIRFESKYDYFVGKPYEIRRLTGSLYPNRDYRRENSVLRLTGNFYLSRDYRRENSVLLTPDRKYAVTMPCYGTAVWELATERKLYSFGGDCQRNDETDNDAYSFDYFRLSPSGNLLLKFSDDLLSVRDLKTGTVLQKTRRSDDKNLQDVSRAINEWDFKGKYTLTFAEKQRSMLVWETNEN